MSGKNIVVEGVVVDYINRKVIPTDKLTKLGSKADHAEFTGDIMGLKLLD